MEKRRSFFKKLFGIGLAGTAISMNIPALAKSNAKTKFIHQVYFWLKNPESSADNEKIVKGLKEMGTIESISLLHIGTPADTDRDVIDNTYHYSFLVGFEDRKGHDLYQEHPIHEKFRNELSEQKCHPLKYLVNQGLFTFIKEILEE
jgi:hypothetical protein